MDDIHPDLKAQPTNAQDCLAKSWADRPVPDDPVHGTHMAATIAGTGAASRKISWYGAEDIYFQAMDSAEEPHHRQPSGPFYPAYSAVPACVNGWGGGPNAYLGYSLG